MDIKAEEKFIKRIGWITKYNWEKLKLIPNWREYFDLSKITPQERFRVFAAIPGLIEGQELFENITPTIGFQQLCIALSGNIATIAEIGVNYHAMGTGNNSPAAGDTQLQTESTRKLLASKTYSGNKAYYTAFYAASEAVGSFTEIGLFINGSATANSGTLWDRSLLAITKSNTQTLTIDYEDTFING
jgi:hypothetical protein